MKSKEATTLSQQDDHVKLGSTFLNSQSQQRLLYPPYQYYFHHTQINQNKQKVINMLQQMGIDVEQLQKMTTTDMIKEAENQLRKSYSVKLVAVKDGEIGVLSKRIEMQKLKQLQRIKTKQNINLNNLPITQQQSYAVNNYFYPKYLKAIKKSIDPKDEEQKQKLLIWQAQQFEKMKGKLDFLLKVEEEQELKDGLTLPEQETTNYTGPDTLKKKNKNQIPPNVKRLNIGQNRSKEFHLDLKDNKSGERFIDQLNHQKEMKKPSYSRLLADLSERDFESATPKNLQIDNTHNVQVATTPQKNVGIIYELEEENEQQTPEQNLNQVSNNVKLPKIKKSLFHIDHIKNENENYQKRIKKIQEKLNEQEQQQH